MEIEFTPEAEAFIDHMCDAYDLTPSLVIQKGLSLLQAYVVGHERGDTWSSTTPNDTVCSIQVPGIG